MVMIFQNATVLNYLLERGYVYTFRTHKHKLGKDWINDGRGRSKIADVNITFVKEVKDLLDLDPYRSISGFDTLGKWEMAIYDFGITEIKGYLYRVSLRRS